MARTIKIRLYSLEELSKKARQKAIESMYDINTDCDWWDFIYDDFKDIGCALGMDVDLERVYHTGFYQQGSGACFTATVNVLELLESISNKKYLDSYPLLEKKEGFNPGPFHLPSRIIGLIKSGWIDISISIEPGRNQNRSLCRCSWNYMSYRRTDYKRLEEQLCDFESWMEDLVKILDDLLYRKLQEEYEFKTSDAEIAKRIMEKEYEFTGDGSKYEAKTYQDTMKKLAA